MAKTDLRNIKCYVLDMDGTLNLGDTLLQGAKELVDLFEKRGIRHFFFTNNSSKSPGQYVEKLNGLGIQGKTAADIITSADVTMHYILKHKKDPAVYLVGTPALHGQFENAGIRIVKQKAQDIDFVVAGFDTTFDYNKADTACDYLMRGVPFLATNIDRVCPLNDGKILPDCASICSMLEHATGRKPRFLGKPFAETVDYILDIANTPPQKTAVVGDRLYTDIMTAVNGGLVSIAVLSGETDMGEIEKSGIQPDYIFDGVWELYQKLV